MSRLDPNSLIPNDNNANSNGGGTPPVGGNLRSPGGGAPQVPTQQTFIQVKGSANAINSRFAKQSQQYDGYDTYKNDENIYIYHFVCVQSPHYPCTEWSRVCDIFVSFLSRAALCVVLVPLGMFDRHTIHLNGGTLVMNWEKTQMCMHLYILTKMI